MRPITPIFPATHAPRYFHTYLCPQKKILEKIEIEKVFREAIFAYWGVRK
jgi:hypothetical protein